VAVENMNTNRFIVHSFLPMLVLAFLLPLCSGCRKKVAAPSVVPVQNSAPLPADSAPPAITPDIPAPSVPEPVEPAMTPKITAVPNSLDLGESSFQARNYVKAVRSYEDYLRTHPKAANRDVVLFRLGLSLIMDGSVRNMRRAEEVLKRLVAEFPGSPYKGPAEFILGLQSQVESLKEDIKEKEAKIKLLSEELQKLKEIDLQRRPSRPSY
jgi:hypothetical protein